jgi:hypothetical protein
MGIICDKPWGSSSTYRATSILSWRSYHGDHPVHTMAITLVIPWRSPWSHREDHLDHGDYLGHTMWITLVLPGVQIDHTMEITLVIPGTNNGIPWRSPQLDKEDHWSDSIGEGGNGTAVRRRRFLITNMVPVVLCCRLLMYLQLASPAYCSFLRPTEKLILRPTA